MTSVLIIASDLIVKIKVEIKVESKKVKNYMNAANPTSAISSLYMPSCIEREGHTQPLATALSLDAGKHLCLQNLLKRCRTLQQRLPREQQGDIPVRLLDSILLKWNQLPTGDYEGRPEGLQGTSLAAMAEISYKLHPIS